MTEQALEDLKSLEEALKEKLGQMSVSTPVDYIASVIINTFEKQFNQSLYDALTNYKRNSEKMQHI